MKKDTDGCRASVRNYIVGGENEMSEKTKIICMDDIQIALLTIGKP